VSKRTPIRSIKSARSYTIAEVARLRGVSLNSVRNWVRAGLPVLRAERPYLIQGAQLKAWLIDRAEARKLRLNPEEMLCLRCKAARTPLGGMVDCTFISSSKVLLTGLCPICGGAIQRFANSRQLTGLATFFDLKFNGPRAP
jgi:hypothetical protein